MEGDHKLLAICAIILSKTIHSYEGASDAPCHKAHRAFPQDLMLAFVPSKCGSVRRFPGICILERAKGLCIGLLQLVAKRKDF